ncbi:MAG: DUF3011 domain-containing protein [Silanimonas sp.]
MSVARYALVVLAAVVASLLPPVASAQYGYDGAQRFRCESHGGQTNYCGVDTRGGVVLVRQLSRGACIEGRSWGWDRRGVWVSQGCRAEFETRVGYGGGWPGGHYGGGHPGGARVVRCESHGGRQNYCGIDTRGGVVLVRQLSRGHCVEGRTWGWDRRGVWVAEGCRGEFASGQGGGWGGPGWNDGGWNHDGGWDDAPGWGQGGVIRCESRNGRTQYCDVGGARDVRLERQLSRGQCTEGYTWGVDRRGLWVSEGCRGEFSVW